MKASEVLEKYKNGHRNFQGLNLREANFTGEDLSGADFSDCQIQKADFSDCQIQGANFKQANLTGANFTGAKAGLQKRWGISLFLVVLVLIAFSSFFCANVSDLVYPIFDPSNTETKVAGWFSLNTLVVFCFITYSQNLAKALVAGALVVAVAVVVAGAFTGAVVGAFIGAVAIALAGAVAEAAAEAFIGTAAVAVAFTVALAGGKAEAVGVAVALALFACFIGYRTLEDETRDPWLRKFVVAFASLGGTSFYGAILTDAKLTGATLKNTNFNQAILIRTCLKDTVKLNLASAENTIIANPTVRDLLVAPKSGYDIKLLKADLRGANLKNANLQQADLSKADISEATLQNANLKDINLTEVNAVKTNFTNAFLTGACLDNWNIDATTILDNVKCQYVYLLNDKQERRPSSGEFQEDEFTKLFEEVFDTVDLIFRDGIDWKAFLFAMKEVHLENDETPLEVQSIEKKVDGVFVVKVHVNPDTNKEIIHQQLVEKYESEKKGLEEKYKKELELQNKEIESYQRENTNLMKIIEMQAENSSPTNIINKINQSHSGEGDNVGHDKYEHNNS